MREAARVLVAARANLARAWRRTLLYGVLYALVAGALLAPFFAWLSLQALALGGEPVATNVDIAGVVASLPGLLAVLAWSLGTALLVLFGLGGQVLLSADAEHGTPRAPRSALRASLAAAPRILSPALLLVGLYELVVVPLLVTAFGVLRAAVVGSDENVYLQIVPDSALGAFGFYAALVLVVVASYVLLVRWTFLLHAVLLEGLPLGAAMKRSAALVASRRVLVLRTVVLVHGLILLGVLLAALVGRGLVWLLFDVLAAGNAPLEIAAAALLLVASTAVGLVGAALIGGAVASVGTALYAHLGGAIPTSAAAGEALRLPLPRTGRGAVLLAGVLLAGGLLLAWPQLGEAFDVGDREVTVTAHRGSSAAAPENTMAAFLLAMEEGADVCELDVLEARDGAVVVIHDANLKRLAGRDANVYDLTGEELQAIDVGSWKGQRFAGQTIPSLRQVIEAVRGRMHLNIEIKVHGHERDLPETVVDLIHELDFADQCVITSLDMGMLRRVRAKDPRLRLGAIVTASVGNVHALDVDFYSVERAQATVPFIRQAHARGRDVHVWTTNAEATMRTMIDRGADSLITDHPARAAALLRARTPEDEVRAALMRLFDR